MTASPTSDPAAQLLARFQGDLGMERLVDVIRQQFLVAGDSELASDLAKVAQLLELGPGAVLIQQDASDSDLFLVLSGGFHISVNQRITGHRAAGLHVGEMAAIDATARRSSAVIASEHSLVAKIPLGDFEAIARKYPEIWRRCAIELCRRLKERNKFHNPPRSEPVVFIGSTVEGLPIAREIQSNFTHDRVVVMVWEKGIFNPGATPIEDLVKVVSECDFGVMLVTPDDKVISRGESRDAPRDNVIFELGLLIGKIGRERTFIVGPRGTDVKIPTDLLGVTPISYDVKKPSWEQTEIAVVSNEIRKIVKKLGPI
jgi:predicted nucleotide-binding protein